jgi:hypothetical protein
MRKLIVVILCFLITVFSFVLLPAPRAEASGWEWRQNDWTGGPGQALWLDNARYESSFRMDATSVPGTLRLSYFSNLSTKSVSPVIAPGAVNAWDNPSIFGYPCPREEEGYEVLYRGTDIAGIRAVGYASSTDGVSWNKSASNPVLQRSGTQPWDAGGVSYGPLLDEGDHYTMFFRGYDAGNIYRYGRAVSTDLISWQRDPGFVFGTGAAGTWDEKLSTIRVNKQGAGYGMWYSAYDAGWAGGLGYAYSPDGLAWNRNAANPVLAGTPGDWDAGGIEGFVLLERPWMGDYMIAYSAQDGLANYAIGLAFSPDGINWTKHAGNPVILTGGAGTWNENIVDVMSLSFDGSFYKLILSGQDGLGKYNVGQSYSDNGLLWFLPTENPILTPSAGPAWDDSAVFSTGPYLEGNTLRLFYSGIGSITPRNGIGTATAAPLYEIAGTLISSVFDAGWPAQWGDVTWNEAVPAGCGVTVYVRTGDVETPDASWSAWAAVTNGAAVPGGNTRYIQYGVELNGTGTATPVVSNIAIDLEAIPTTWYFAEGYTGAGFDEWITIQNSNLVPADVTVTYYTPGGTPVDRNHHVDANSRYTIYVNSDLGPNRENSFRVSSSQKIICERPMYFRYSGLGLHDWQGGSDAMGSTGLSRRWYFAEGYTAAGFEEWITVQNPGAEWATVDVTYFVGGGEPFRKQHRVAPTSRYTIMVNQDAGADLEVSAMLHADQPILAERPMYFDFQGSMAGGHIVMGSPCLAEDWYLAEGATFDPFTEYITIQNPNPAAATVVVSYYTPGGAPITVSANSRYTINAGQDSGVASDLSAYVHSNQPVLVERPMYFNMLYGGLPGGHCAVGVNSPSTSWYFAEGYTGPGFDEYLTVQNPGTAAANLIVTYTVEGGMPIVRNHTVQPQSRFTINVGDDADRDLSLSIGVNSDQPVICERPMYFFYQGYHSYNWPGGHDSQGFAP